MKKHHPFVVSLRAGSGLQTPSADAPHWPPAHGATASLDVTIWTGQRRPRYWQLRAREGVPS